MSIFSHHSKTSRGFTLVELLVVISVVLVLTSIFLIRQQRFNSATVLRSLAYGVALSVRQAQVYGTAFRESTTANAYGIYFSDGGAALNQYVLFADLDRDGQYDSNEVINTFRISQGYTISKFCATPNVGAQQCWTLASPNITNLTILFRRPNPDACFATSLNAGACASGASAVYSSASMQLSSSGDSRSVNITLTGQISVGGSGS